MRLKETKMLRMIGSILLSSLILLSSCSSGEVSTWSQTDTSCETKQVLNVEDIEVKPMQDITEEEIYYIINYFRYSPMYSVIKQEVIKVYQTELIIRELRKLND